MMPRRRRPAVGLAAAVALALAVPAGPALADRPAPPSAVPLVTGSMPEGISAGPRGSFFVGARSDGAVYVGKRNGTLRTLVPGAAGEIALGLRYDGRTGRLWVAGARTGDVTAYDARSGRVLFTVDTDGPDDRDATGGATRLLNDIAVTPEAVYVTDSLSAELVVVPTPGGELPAPGDVRTLPLTGDYVQPAGIGANGILVLPTGDLLLISGGLLHVVDPATGVTDLVEQAGRPLTGGDGLVLSGSTLYVVYGFDDRDSVVQLRLSSDLRSSTFVREITAAGLDRPTTAALVGGDLLVVNGRFATIGDQPDAPVYLTRIVP